MKIQIKWQTHEYNQQIIMFVISQPGIKIRYDVIDNVRFGRDIYVPRCIFHPREVI
jgi:hypothetical protein